MALEIRTSGDAKGCKMAYWRRISWIRRGKVGSIARGNVSTEQDYGPEFDTFVYLAAVGKPLLFGRNVDGRGLGGQYSMSYYPGLEIQWTRSH